MSYVPEDTFKMTRRNFFIVSGTVAGGIFYCWLDSLKNKTDTLSMPEIRTPTQTIPRTVGKKNIPVPRSWVDDRTLERVSVEGNPLNKDTIDSLRMLPMNNRGYCKSGEPVDVKGFGITIPDMYEKLGKDFSATKGRIIVTATDLYALIPAEPEKAFFSASKDNIPEKYWKREGFELAKRIKMAPYGVFPQNEKAWHNNSDTQYINSYKGDFEPGTYFVYPNGEIIKPENKDVSMPLNKFSLKIIDNGLERIIHYSDIQKECEDNREEYNGKELPSMLVKRMFEYAGINLEGKTLIFHANKYAVSIPSRRQEDLLAVFDKRITEKHGTPMKVKGPYVNSAAQIGGPYRAELISTPA